ncbi:hypothetical protein B0H12DRAFT_1244105 [Mycena haematopus]|nr:hypothetical protein B0H12DRAFT_1244105 [Mycena haematopus]
MPGPKKKTGKPSDFQGKRAEFLQDFYPTYADASKRNKTRGIWRDFFITYWARFPWRLPLTQDPDPDDPTDYALPPQNEDEEALKAKIMPQIESKIKSYLGRQGKASGMKDNPWAPWLTRFRAPAGPAPKKLADYQFYMQHNDFKSKVAEEFKLRSSGIPAAEHLKLRAHIAKEFFLAEEEEVRTKMRQEAEAEHEALLKAHQDGLEGLPAVEEEDMDE